MLTSVFSLSEVPLCVDKTIAKRFRRVLKQLGCKILPSDEVVLDSLMVLDKKDRKKGVVRVARERDRC